MKSLLVLNKYFWKYKRQLTLGIVFVALSNLFAIFPAQLIRYSFDHVKESIQYYRLFNGCILQQDLFTLIGKSLLYFGVLVLVLSIIKGVFMFFMRQAIIVMSRHIEYDQKNEIYEHYQKLPLSFYKVNNTGDLMNRISEDVGRVRMYIGPAIMYTINLVVLFVLVIVTMLSVNAKLTMYVLFPLPILSLTVYYVSDMINKRSERVQAKLSDLSTLSQEAYSGIRVIKAYGKEETIIKEMEKESLNYKDINLGLVKVNALFQPAMILLIGISTIITVYIGGLLAIEGEISTGNIAEFVVYVNMLTWPVASVGWVTSLVQRAAASQTRINEFLDTKPEIVNKNESTYPIKGDIEFRNVSFTYPDSGTRALQNVSFTIEAGKTLAVIGRTGSGKSTIANLLCRLFEVNEGVILIDGKPLKEHNVNLLRDETGYVPQEVFLFSDTIANNIAFGVKAAEVSRKDVERAAKDAVIYSNIMEFPQNFDTILGERGITLSGGQKQRVSIARAIIKKPRILVFDDCLSAVDTETEDTILKNLKREMSGRTSIIISHRVSSVKNADSIIVLDRGKIIEKGTHQELINLKGDYFELYQKQLLEEEVRHSID